MKMNKSVLLPVALLVLLSVVLIGCLNKKNNDAPLMPAGAITGTFGLQNVFLTLGANSLTAYSAPTIVEVTNAPAIVLANVTAFGNSYQMSPAGLIFSAAAPATLTMKFDKNNLPANAADPGMVRIYAYVGNTWVEQSYSSAPPSLVQDATNANLFTIISSVSTMAPYYRLAADVTKAKAAPLAISVLPAKAADGVTNVTQIRIPFTKELDGITAIQAASFTLTIAGTDYDLAAAVIAGNAVITISADKLTVTITLTDPTLNDPAEIDGKTVAVTVTANLKTAYLLPVDTTIQPPVVTANVVVATPSGFTPAIGTTDGAITTVYPAGTANTKVSWTAVTVNGSSAGITYMVQATVKKVVADIVADPTTIAAGDWNVVYELTASTNEFNVVDINGTGKFDWEADYDFNNNGNILYLYYIRVKAVYTNGTSTFESAAYGYTNVRYDKANNLPTAPSALVINAAAVNAATVYTNAATLGWTASTDADGNAITYLLQIHNAAITEGVTPLVEIAGMAVTTQLLSATGDADFTTANFDDKTVYWRVKAIDSRQGSSTWANGTEFFLNFENDAVAISAMDPSAAKAILKVTATGFTATVTNTDKDTLGYEINIYSDALAATATLKKYTGTALPISVLPSDWTAVDDTTYYWTLTVTETAVTFGAAGLPVVSSVASFKVSGDDDPPTVAITAGSDLGESTQFTWAGTDPDSITLKYQVAVTTTADTAVANPTFTTTTDTVAVSGTIKGFFPTHTLVTGTTYLLAIRANDDADLAAANTARTSKYGAWKTQQFTFQSGPTISKVIYGNMTPTGMAIVWTTTTSATNSKVYYAFDGADPGTNPSNIAENSDAQKGIVSNGFVHAAYLSWADGSRATIKFYVSSENATVAGVTSIDNNGGAFYTASLAPSFNGTPSNDTINAIFKAGDFTNGADVAAIKVRGTIVNGEDGEGMPTLAVVKTYYYISSINNDRVAMIGGNNRFNIEAVVFGTGYDAVNEITGFATSNKVVDVLVIKKANGTLTEKAGPYALTVSGIGYDTAEISK